MSKIARPDRSAFEKEFNELKEKLALHQDKHKKANEALRSSGSSKNDPEWQALLDQLKIAKSERDEGRQSIQGVLGEIRALDSEVQKKTREIAAMRPKSGYKSDDEFNRAISNLEQQVESGSLKLVDEKKAIKEIGYLKSSRKSIAGIPKLEAEVAELKKQIGEKRKTVDDSKLKAANAKIDEINAKLDAHNSKRKDAAKAKNVIWEARREADNEIKSIRSAMDAAKKDFNGKLQAYRDATAEDRRRKAEEEKAAKDELLRARKLRDAENKVEASKESAFAPQLSKAHTLLDYFAPWTHHDEATTKESAPANPNGEVSIQKAKISAPPSRKELKRRNNNRNEKLRLDVGVIDSLSSLNIAIPKDTKEAGEIAHKIKEKINFYKENDERVTKEKVERAKEALAKLKQELADEATVMRPTEVAEAPAI